ncbi:MAG: hypothetical protein QNJ97_16990 [Myxococcota bacterium]|nr:hypothetical protein [Myxococcota bacterium]
MVKVDALAIHARWAALFLAIVCCAVIGRAEEIVCPICGKAFPDTTENCPNDGANLKSLGIPLASKAKDEDDTPDIEDQDTGMEDPAASTETTESSPKYKRLDSEKAHRAFKRNDGKKDRTGYSDRFSRVARERPALSSGTKKHRQDAAAALFQEEDLRRRSEYERIRAREWANRRKVHAVKEILAEKDRQKVKDRIVEGIGAPITSLGMRLFWMAEGDDPGLVKAAEIDLNLARYRLRLGLSSLIGVRALDARDELIFLEHISAGFQWPRRYSPFALIKGGIGVLASDRFGSTLVYFITSFGVEIGIDAWISPWISVTPVVGYERCMLDDAYWNSFTYKVSVGF